MTITEIRKQWSRVLKRASMGEVIIMTRRGVPIATFVPPPTESNKKTKKQG
jgi:prevent-host-death family protein